MGTRTLAALALGAAVALGAAPARAEGSRWVALLPFGAGQFQNGDIGGGMFFLLGEALFGGTAIATAAQANTLAHSSPSAGAIDAANARLSTLTAVNRISFAAWGVLTAAGVLEAQIRFRPGCATVTASAGPGTAVVGLGMAF